MRSSSIASANLAALAFGLFLACSSSDSKPSGATGGSGGEGGEAGSCGAVDLNGRGNAVPAPPDGASLCPSGPCNYQTQEGCADDEACRPLLASDATDIEVGCEAAGTGKSGDSCSDSSDCGRGYMCVGQTADDRECRRLCCGGDWSACDVGESCIRQLYLGIDPEHTEYAVDLCFPVNNCDPFDSNSCDDPKRECKVVDATGAVACAPRSTAGLGDACDESSGCMQGFTCVGRQGQAHSCRRLCRAEQCGEPSCPSEEGTCVHYQRNPPGIGECTPDGE